MRMSPVLDATSPPAREDRCAAEQNPGRATPIRLLLLIFTTNDSSLRYGIALVSYVPVACGGAAILLASSQ